MAESRSAFIGGIKEGDLAQVREELELKDIDVNGPINGRYPVHYAAAYGHHDVLAFLLQQGADVNAKDQYDVGPLLVAVWEGHTKCVELLLAHGAEKEGLTPDGKTFAEAAEKEDIKKLLM